MTTRTESLARRGLVSAHSSGLERTTDELLKVAPTLWSETAREFGHERAQSSIDKLSKTFGVHPDAPLKHHEHAIVTHVYRNVKEKAARHGH